MQALLVQWTNFPIGKLHKVERSDQVVVSATAVFVSSSDGRNLIYTERLPRKARNALIREGTPKHPSLG